MWRASLVGLVLLVCSCAPTGANDVAPVSKALDQARSRWSEAGIAHYRLTVVEKLHDVVSRMVHDVEGFAAPEFGRHQLAVTFDAHGVPEAINFDLANGSDEESSMQVTFAEDP